ncbi:MAG: hypothetical protein QOH06_944 [Acidobacteriota bacterium]|jgi:hypothetical protein|nr:hypothetical protein [Acidobacteriota bacterium]
MRRKLLLWIAPWIALGLGACATVQPPAAISKACAEWRWIGITRSAEDECPPIPGWKEERLFPSLAAERLEAGAYVARKEFLAAPDPEVVQELKRFCVFEPTWKSGKAPAPPAPTGKLVRIDQDCAAISVAGDPDKITDWETFSERFLQQAGKTGTALEIKNRRGVRLAFLDTHPTGDVVPTEPPHGELASEHGYTLTHIARNLICSPEDTGVCAAQITTRLALPITKFDSRSRKGTKTDEKHGGRIGLQSDLAEAIRAEVDDWLVLREKEDAPQHLVINLSVAWDGDRFGGLDEGQVANMRTGTQAVYWALRYASGFDVLVLAAAGNKSTCATERPLLPAAWENGAPREEVCGERSRTPLLLYAVGGVDSEGKPLSNARDRAMPPRAAYGASAVVPALTPGDSTAKYTGTSVSTAVVSSIAAIVWDTLPDRSPSQIMDILYRSGDDLPPLQADFGSGAGAAGLGAGSQVRRLSLCPALLAACEELGGRGGCPMRELSCEPWTPVANLPSSPPLLSSCHPWVQTQPPTEPCPVCEPPRFSQ